MNIRADLIKVVVFVTVTGLFTALIAMTMGDIRIQDTAEYTARFREVSGLREGVDVRAAGVPVGSVEALELQPDSTVLVRFTAAEKVRLTDATSATVRYKNLAGDLYLDLTADRPGGAALPEGGTIPMERTKPALDIELLTNGFKPLMEGLSPREINELSGSMIAVFQGQSGAVNSVLEHVGSLTSTLADRDELIGRLVDNLHTVLGTVESNRSQFGELVSGLRELTGGLAKDRHTIGGSLSDIQSLSSTATDFLTELRPEFAETMRQLNRVSSTLNSRADRVDHYLGLLPLALRKTGRASAYGSFFNFYLCGVRVKLSDAKGVGVYSPFVLSEEQRCQFTDGGR